MFTEGPKITNICESNALFV